MIAELLFGIIIAHFVGDYLLQAHWMATQKTERWWPAIVHGVLYTVPYAILLWAFSGWTTNGFVWSIAPLLVIAVTHILIDHWRLAKHVGWLKNQIGPKDSRPGFHEAMANGGYTLSTQPWMAVFLMIVTDNTLHLLINTAAILWL